MYGLHSPPLPPLLTSSCFFRASCSRSVLWRRSACRNCGVRVQWREHEVTRGKTDRYAQGLPWATDHAMSTSNVFYSNVQATIADSKGQTMESCTVSGESGVAPSKKVCPTPHTLCSHLQRLELGHRLLRLALGLPQWVLHTCTAAGW